MTSKKNPLILIASGHLEVGEFLDTLRYQVHEVADGEACIAALQTHKPDLIILAMDLLDGLGIDVCQQIRQKPAYADIPIIMLTNPDVTQIETCLAAGSDDCLTTPISPALINLRIAQLLISSKHVPAPIKTQMLPKANHLRHIFYDDMPVMMCSIDRKGHIIDINHKWQEETGYTLEEIQNQPFIDLLPNEMATWVRAELMPHFWKEGILEEVDLKLIRKDGTLMDILVNCRALTNFQGQQMGLVVINDITIQKHIEETLQSSENEMRSILASMSDRVVVFDSKGMYIKIASTNIQTQYSPSTTVLGRTLHDIFPEQADMFLDYIQQALSKNETISAEYNLLVDGEQKWFHASISPLQGEQQVVWVSRDITERKRSEMALQHSEQRYRSLFEHANESIFLTDPVTTQIIDANQYATQMLGYTRSELQQLTLHKLAAEGTPAFQEQMQQHSGSIIEQAYRHKDGHTIPFETRNQLIQFGDQMVVLTFARDIRERRLAEAAEREQRTLAEALRDTAAAINSTLRLPEVLDLILENVSRVVDSKVSNIMLIEGEKVVVRGQRGYKQIEIQPERVANLVFNVNDTTNFRLMVESQQPILVTDTHNDPIWQYVEETRWIRSYVGTPIIIDDEVIGFINLDSRQPNHFTNKDAERLRMFANYAALAIRNARLFDSIQRQAGELQEHVAQRTADLTETNQQLKREIIERNRAEIKLQEEHNLLQTLINTLPQDIYIKDLQGRLSLVNTRAAQFFGKQDVIGNTEMELIDDPDLAVKRYEAEQRLMHTDEISRITYEEEWVDKTGNHRWAVTTKIPLRDTNGRVRGLVGVRQDITDIRQAENQLRQIISSANCLIWFSIVVKQPDNTMDWTNYVTNEEAAQNFLPVHIEATESYTEAWLNSRVPEDHERTERTANQAILSGKTNYTQEFRCQGANGQIYWLNEDARITSLTPGRWSLVGVCTDITERKQAEAALQQSHAELERRINIRTAELTQANETLRQEIADRKRAQEAELKRAQELEILRQANLQLNATLELKPIMQIIVDYALRLTRARGATLFLYEDSQLRFGAAMRAGQFWDAPTNQPRPHGLTYSVIEKNQSITIPDMSDHPMFEGTSWTGSIAGIPLHSGESIVGVLNVDYETPHQFDENELRVLELLADQSTFAILNAQHVRRIADESAERKRAEAAERDQRILAEALRDAAQSVSRSLEIDRVLHGIIHAVTRVVPPHETSSILLVEDDNTIGTHYNQRHENNAWLTSVTSPQISIHDMPVLSHIMETRMPIALPNTQYYTNWSDQDGPDWLKSYVAAPILSEGDIIGFITLGSKNTGTFTGEHSHRLQAFANQASIAIQNARLVERIRQAANVLSMRVKERTAELEYERGQLRAIMDSMRDGVIYQDVNRHPQLINQALVDLTGYSHEEWMSLQALRAINLLGASDREELWPTIYETLEHQGFWHGETKIQRKDGHIFDASLTRTGVFDGAGQFLGIVTVIQDISQAKQLAEQKSRFIASASHELRTPIANMKTRLYLMKRQPEKFEYHLDVLETVTRWMQSLVENLFDVSRFERGIIELDSSEFDLCALATEVIQTQQPEAEQKQIVLTYHSSLSKLTLNGDQQRLKQVFTNLVSNAIHYTASGGKIDFRLFLREEQQAVVEVADNGIGIPEEHLPYIFQPFVQAHQGNSKGAGLGLSIAYEIVQLHGGDMTVTSTEGEGSTFTVMLPLTKQ